MYGPRQDPKGEAGVIAIFIGKMLAKEPVIINGDGEQQRDFVHVSECAYANYLALQAPSGIYNLGSGYGVSVNQIFDALRKITGYPHDAQHGPAKLGETRTIYLDASLALKAMGWKPEITLEDGLRQTLEYQTQREALA